MAKKPIVIDTHTHILFEDVFARTSRHSLMARTGIGRQTLSAAQPNDASIGPKLFDPKPRLKDMDRMGIDVQVVSPSIVHQNSYKFAPAEAIEIDRLNNDLTAEYVSRHPDRFVGVGMVPLHDPKGAARELDRMVNKLGLRGVQISSVVNEMEIGDKRLWPFWRKAEKLGVPVFIHPAGNDNPRLHRFGFAFTIGQPWEEALAMSSLIFDGVMDAFPKLKVMIAHGGGYLPYYAGRLDGGYAKMRRDKRPTKLKRNLSGYLKRFYYDSVIFNPDMLEFLASKVPIRHIMMGTDYPFGEDKPVQFVRKAKKLSKANQDAILGGNAAKLFRIHV